jgi:hypothetical protein
MLLMGRCSFVGAPSVYQRPFDSASGVPERRSDGGKRREKADEGSPSPCGFRRLLKDLLRPLQSITGCACRHNINNAGRRELLYDPGVSWGGRPFKASAPRKAITPETSLGDSKSC